MTTSFYVLLLRFIYINDRLRLSMCCCMQNKVAKFFDRLGYDHKTGFVLGATCSMFSYFTSALLAIAFFTAGLIDVGKEDVVSDNNIAFLVLGGLSLVCNCMSLMCTLQCCVSLCRRQELEDFEETGKDRKLYEIVKSSPTEIRLVAVNLFDK